MGISTYLESILKVGYYQASGQLEAKQRPGEKAKLLNEINFMYLVCRREETLLLHVRRIIKFIVCFPFPTPLSVHMSCFDHVASQC